MKLISQLCSYFKEIRWRYLILLIAVYMICSSSHELLTGHNFNSLVTTILNDWPLYLTMVVVYIMVSIVKQSNSSNKS